MSLYNLKSTGTALYSITKFDNDLNPEATYSTGHTICDCPAGHRLTCRHRQMLPTLLPRIDTAYFYNFDHRTWVDPTGMGASEAPTIAYHRELSPNEDIASAFAGVKAEAKAHAEGSMFPLDKPLRRI